jgi:hypothetical protein
MLKTDRDANGVPSVRVQTRLGRWLTFHGTRTETRPGSRDDTTVIIELSRPQELAWLQVSACGLSERERGPRCAGYFYQGDLTGALHLRVHRPRASFERMPKRSFYEKASFVKADLTMFACRRSRLHRCPGGSGMAQG